MFRTPFGDPAPGTYPLVTFSGALTGSLENLEYDPGFSSLQTQLEIVDGAIRLVVFPPPIPEVLAWRGAGSVWDNASDNWLLDGQPATFSNNDFVYFGPGGSAAPVISIEGEVQPESVTFDSPTDYTLNGPGTIGGAATLQKSNTGNLTISGANSFTGATQISGGTVFIGNAAALGSGPVILSGGTWATGTLTPQNSILVTADSTITGGHGGGNHGVRAISGNHVLTLAATNVFDLEGNLADFNGTLFLNGTGSFRLFGASNGSAAVFDLGTRWLNSRSGSAFAIGALAGGPGSHLAGSSGGGNNAQVTYTIGARNTPTTFSGNIVNGNNVTHIIKTGTSTLTLAGQNSHTGNTIVQNGTLELTGSLAATPTTIEAEGRLSGNGSTLGSLTCHGALSPSGTLTLGNGLTTTPGSVLEFRLGEDPDRIDVTGNLSLAGRIEISATSGIATGVYPIISYTGTANFGDIELGTLPGDYTCQLDLETPGMVNAIITSTLSPFEQWQILYFGSTDNPLAQAGEDPDGDGQSNQIEFAAGTHPQDGTSRFAASVVSTESGEFTITWPSVPGESYEILINPTLTGQWDSVATIIAGPGTTSSHTLSRDDHGDEAFFRVRINE